MTSSDSAPTFTGREDRTDYVRRRMLRQLQHEADLVFGENARFPRNDEEVDPVVRDLYQSVAYEITRLEDRVQALTLRSVEALARRLADPLRLRQPACTVVSLQPRDSGVELAAGLSFARSTAYGAEVFTSTEALIAHRILVPFTLVVAGREAAIVRNEQWLGEDEGRDKERVENHQLPSEVAGNARGLRVYIPIVGECALSAETIDLFFVGNQRLLDQLFCGVGHLAGADGEFVVSTDCCAPAGGTPRCYEFLKNPLRIRSTMRSAREVWGHAFLRCRIGEAANLPREVRELGPGVMAACAPLGGKTVRWIKVALMRGGAREWAEGLRGLHTNCVPVTNVRRPVVAAYKMPWTLIAPTGGSVGRLEYEIELPIECCEVESVRDQESNVEYFDVHQLLESRPDRGRYKVVMRTRSSGLPGPVLVLMPPAKHDPLRPLRPQLHLLECSAPNQVNGLRPGEVNTCHEQDPRILAVVNVVPVDGAVDVSSADAAIGDSGIGLITRVEQRLVTLQDFETATHNIAGSGPGDPRILDRECCFQPFRMRGALVQGLLVKLVFDEARLSCVAEGQFVTACLQRDLASRSLANIEVRVIAESRAAPKAGVAHRSSEVRA